MRFDLTDLRLFLHVVEAGSITAGAGRANMALASASERLRGMEAAAGVTLVTRGRRGVETTPAGRALVHHARLILDGAERLRAELAQHGQGLKSHVRFMANTSALAEHLPAPLAGFLAANAEVDVDLEEGASRDIARAVAAGRIDFGVISDRVDAGDLATRLFRHDALALVTTRDHPLAGRGQIAFSETLEAAHVGLSADSALEGYLAGQARRLGRSLVARVRVLGLDAVCQMAEQGVGVGLVPIVAARRARRSMAIAITPLSDFWAKRNLVVATRPGASPTPQARRLIAWLLADVPTS